MWRVTSRGESQMLLKALMDCPFAQPFVAPPLPFCPCRNIVHATRVPDRSKAVVSRPVNRTKGVWDNRRRTTLLSEASTTAGMATGRGLRASLCGETMPSMGPSSTSLSYCTSCGAPSYVICVGAYGMLSVYPVVVIVYPVVVIDAVTHESSILKLGVAPLCNTSFLQPIVYPAI